VVQFNDFDRLEVFGCLRGEGGGQHRAKGEIGGDQDAGPRAACQQVLQPGQLAGVPAGGAHNGVDAMFDGEAHVRFSAFGNRQVHHEACPRNGELVQ
jgi:hypothetical protein